MGPKKQVIVQGATKQTVVQGGHKTNRTVVQGGVLIVVQGGYLGELSLGG